MSNTRKKAGRKITLRNRKKKGKPVNIKKIETLEEALERGIKIETLTPISHQDKLNKVNAAITKQYRMEIRKNGVIE
ncbi:MAG: hypothetical protein CMG00_05975 [Candidatus Marinimicrobia bacterium]|nr:hypothetical protein [Candidatus Neomarinimicrobiota bacterium]|tara:strand:+ start:2308 stop:2538 length:231 start_codon:yes stop_codon:yes gene_type:complete